MRGNGGKTRIASSASFIARATDGGDAGEAATDRILLRAFWSSQVSRPGLAKVVSLTAARDARASRSF